MRVFYNPPPKTLHIDRFDKGLYQVCDSAAMPIGSAEEMSLCDVSGGNIHRAKGLQILGQMPLFDPDYGPTGETLSHMVSCTASKTTPQFLLCRGADLYKVVTAGGFIDLYPCTTSVPWGEGLSGLRTLRYDKDGDFCLLVANDNQPVAEFTGGTALSLITTAPRAKALQLYKERIFAVPFEEQGSVQCSDEMDAGNWTFSLTEGAKIHLGLYDGTLVLGMYVLGDALYIVKENAVFKLWGSSPRDFATERVCSLNGYDIKVDTLCQCDQSLLFMSLGKLYAFTGGEVREIGQRVEKYLRKAVAYRAFYLNDVYYLQLCYTDPRIIDTVLEYHVKKGRFTAHEGVKFFNMTPHLSRIYALTQERQLALYGEAEPEACSITETVRYKTCTYFAGDGQEKSFLSLQIIGSSAIAAPVHMLHWFIDGVLSGSAFYELPKTPGKLDIPLWGRGRSISFELVFYPQDDFCIDALSISYYPVA